MNLIELELNSMILKLKFKDLEQILMLPILRLKTIDLKLEILKLELLMKEEKLQLMILMTLIKWLPLLKNSFQPFKAKLIDTIIIVMDKDQLLLNRLEIQLSISLEDKDLVII